MGFVNRFDHIVLFGFIHLVVEWQDHTSVCDEVGVGERVMLVCGAIGKFPVDGHDGSAC